MNTKLFITDTNEHPASVKVSKWADINHFDTLCLYCADNDIKLNEISDHEFDAMAITLKHYGQDVKHLDSFYFWIEQDR